MTTREEVKSDAEATAAGHTIIVEASDIPNIDKIMLHDLIILTATVMCSLRGKVKSWRVAIRSLRYFLDNFEKIVDLDDKNLNK